MKLREYYNTLPKRELLVGCKVQTVDGQILYVLNVDDGLWCGPDRDREDGWNFSIDDLELLEIAEG